MPTISKGEFFIVDDGQDFGTSTYTYDSSCDDADRLLIQPWTGDQFPGDAQGGTVELTIEGTAYYTQAPCVIRWTEPLAMLISGGQIISNVDPLTGDYTYVTRRFVCVLYSSFEGLLHAALPEMPLEDPFTTQSKG